MRGFHSLSDQSPSVPYGSDVFRYFQSKVFTTSYQHGRGGRRAGMEHYSGMQPLQMHTSLKTASHLSNLTTFCRKGMVRLVLVFGHVPAEILTLVSKGWGEPGCWGAVLPSTSDQRSDVSPGPSLLMSMFLSDGDSESPEDMEEEIPVVICAAAGRMGAAMAAINSIYSNTDANIVFYVVGLRNTLTRIR